MVEDTVEVVACGVFQFPRGLTYNVTLPVSVRVYNFQFPRGLTGLRTVSVP